jgi:two-component system sensor histidine kinase SenX3
MSENESISFSTILASTIHDVKNSLGVVLNSLDELIRTAGDSLPGEQLGKLQYEAKRVNNNLVQLLALYKMENKGLKANIDEYPVRDLLEDILLSEKAMLESRKIKLEYQCASDIVWYFDRDLVSGVLKNAINNAIRYTKDTVLITANEEDGYLVLAVNDNGPGFPEGMLADGEQQGHGINFSSGNTGLGLYFTSRVAEMHKNKDKKGRIELTNGHMLGGGCFSIKLP